MKQLITIALLLSLSGCAYYSDYYGTPDAYPEGSLDKAQKDIGKCAFDHQLVGGTPHTLTEEAQYMAHACEAYVRKACWIKARTALRQVDRSILDRGSDYYGNWESRYFRRCMENDGSAESFLGLADIGE